MRRNRLNQKNFEKCATNYCGFLRLPRFVSDKTTAKGSAIQVKRRSIVGKMKAEGVRLVCLVAVFAVVFGSSSVSYGAEDKSLKQYELNIPQLPVAEALNKFSEQTGAVLLFPYDLVEGRSANAVRGRYDLTEALEILLEGSGLSGGHVQSEVIRISLGDGNTKTDREDEMASGKVRKGLLATVSALMFGAGGAYAEDNPQTADDKEKERDTIVVIGTNIRGATVDSSPDQQFDSTDILRSGARTVQDFVRILPQNFNGGASEYLVRGSPRNPEAGANVALGSSVNLRGLGSGATLTLIDGQRLAPSSSLGDFVDISLLPLNAVQSVQVLPDGASALYGGDAVAGVVNFALRDSFDGAESFAAYGNVTEGDSPEYRAGQTVGVDWGTGHGIITYDFYQRDPLSVLDKDFSEAIGRPIDLLPRQVRHSAMLAFRQDVGSLEAWGRVLYGTRDARVRRSNTETVAIRTVDADTDQISGLGGIRGSLAGAWTFDVSGVYSKVRSASDTPAVAGAGQAVSRENFSTLYGGEVKVSGPLFTLPGGDVDLAAGFGLRKEDFSTTNRVTGINDRMAGRNVKFGFGELLVPFFGADNAAPGLQRLELNVSGRIEDYSDFGSTVNPKVGLLWAPVRDVNFRASYGTSFNPPNLGALNARDTQANYLTNDILNFLLPLNPEIPDGRTALLVLGTGPELHEEKSRSWTFGADATFDAGPGKLSISGTNYEISFSDRIAQLDVPGGGFNIFNIYLSSPEFLPPGTVVENPSQQLVDDILARSLNEGGVFNNFGIPTDNVGLIAYIQTINVAKTVTRGLDVDLGYQVPMGRGALNASLSGNYIFNLKSQSSIDTPSLENVDLIFQPADLRLRGGLGWNSDILSVNTYVNYTDSYSDNRSATPVKVPSFTTVDLFVTYLVPLKTGLLDGVRLDFGVDNLFNKEPPFIGNDYQFGIMGYDPANADPIGRFVSFKITTKW